MQIQGKHILNCQVQPSTQFIYATFDWHIMFVSQVISAHVLRNAIRKNLLSFQKFKSEGTQVFVIFSMMFVILSYTLGLPCWSLTQHTTKQNDIIHKLKQASSIWEIHGNSILGIPGEVFPFLKSQRISYHKQGQFSIILNIMVKSHQRNKIYNCGL